MVLRNVFRVEGDDIAPAVNKLIVFFGEEKGVEEKGVGGKRGQNYFS